MSSKRIAFIIAFLLLTLGPALFLSDLGSRTVGLVSLPASPQGQTAELPR